MWDPISIFYICYMLNYNLPAGRLNVTDIIKEKEDSIIIETVTIREGI